MTLPHRIQQLLHPPFIYKRSCYAALYVIAFLIAGIVFLISSSSCNVNDVNHDGDIDWNEVYINWILPKGNEWWKYLLGLGCFGVAANVMYSVYKFDKEKQARGSVAEDQKIYNHEEYFSRAACYLDR